MYSLTKLQQINTTKPHEQKMRQKSNLIFANFFFCCLLYVILAVDHRSTNQNPQLILQSLLRFVMRRLKADFTVAQ